MNQDDDPRIASATTEIPDVYNFISEDGMALVNIDADETTTDDKGNAVPAVKAGSYVVKVTVSDDEKDIVKKFTVKVKTATLPDEADDYTFKVELDNKTMDLNPEERAYDTLNQTGNIKVRLAQYVGSVFAGYRTLTENDNVYVTSGSDAYSDVTLYDEDVIVKNGTISATDASIVDIWGKDLEDSRVEATGTDANKYVIRYIEVKDTFNDIEYHYFVPVSKTFTSK